MSIGNPHGLYVPTLEKDACGIGLIADLNNNRTHSTIENALTILERMEHRGATGYETNSGDGAGITLHIPHDLYSDYFSKDGIDLPNIGHYGVSMLFLPKEESLRIICMEAISRILEKYNLAQIGIREVPTDNSDLGELAKSAEPQIVQLFVKSHYDIHGKDLERILYLLRCYITHYIHGISDALRDDFYICSFSSRTIIYKGQLTTDQLRNYYPDLTDRRSTSAIAIVHSRFSTNTIPKWKLAQPFRTIAHNGEINTIQGNLNWWKAKEKSLQSAVFSDEELQMLFPICDEGGSDSAIFDNVLEFMVHNGRSIPHALMMMIPEAWHNDPYVDPVKKDFYKFHEAFMEPWDGPASICFTDGILVGATLDRNGLRPSRFVVTKENVLILGSESGCLPIDPSMIQRKGRLEPGKILIADLEERRIIEDDELKSTICSRAPYSDWLELECIEIEEVAQNVEVTLPDVDPHIKVAYGMSKEDEEVILSAMKDNGKEPIGSMGCDIPLAVLSTQAQHIGNYFKQLFAQVTNPPIDPLRENAFMTLETFFGGEPNVIYPRQKSAKMIRLRSPILSKEAFYYFSESKELRSSLYTISSHFPVNPEEGSLEDIIAAKCSEAYRAIKKGINIIIINDEGITKEACAIPSLLMMGYLHHYLIHKGVRREVSIIVKGGDIVETHHCALLISYGADAVYPWLMNSILKEKGAIKNYYKALELGLLKVMSKLGISTLQSYHGAQTYEAVGIHPNVIEKCFKGTVSRIEGMDFDDLAREQMAKHKIAFSHQFENRNLPESGVFQWKKNGEYHLFNPKSIHLLQHSTRTNNYDLFLKYSAEINAQAGKAATMRSFFDFEEGKSIPIEEVEPIENIMKRFATGAMSFGSISYEAHSTLAIAMNRIGGKSNSGEGGEDEFRYKRKENGDIERSAIKQVASGRFGVTSNYLVNADQIQIKMAQGAKPGEGGQLPGHKVNQWIAKVRHSIPGVGLISPPPHHDIYSIEDLAQLIYDLKNANRHADISVKLVSKAGVGIIASGVAKAHADHILISGYDGGTGASPLSSIRHAGLPWELGLAETHQTLVKNKLRDRVTLQCDGQMKTGKDLAIATLLGAEEWGIATAALVVEGCILMRKCHLNTCPVGIATQNETLRKKFDGKVEHLVHFFTFLATELREIMARLGFRSIEEMVGRADMLKVRNDIDHWKWKTVDLTPILSYGYKNNQSKAISQDHNLGKVLDRKLIKYADLAISQQSPINTTFPIQNTDRATGTMLSSEISKKYGSAGLPEDTINYRFRGTAGQSFGAFSVNGLSFTLEGDANDYFGKGMCGSKLIVVPDRKSTFTPEDNIIIGNVALYGATSGEAYIKGMAGERFCVRNSGAIAVVEGIGAHGCEYMTGGEVVILGEVGRNFGAGMSGGIAYVRDMEGSFDAKTNMASIDLVPLETQDKIQLRQHIRNHFQYTGSLIAIGILNNWEEEKQRFIKVFPKEYRKVLETLESQKGQVA